METVVLNNDIKVLYVTASSFPEGIMNAHEKLHALVPPSSGRKYFGLSRPENGYHNIVYRAAAEELSAGEAKALNCETLIIQKGNYISETVNDYTKDLQRIGQCFEKLLSQPGLDPQGYCVEWYLNDSDVKCMIRLQD